MIKDMKEAFQKMFDNFSRQADIKLVEILKAMQNRFKTLSRNMENMNEEKINEF